MDYRIPGVLLSAVEQQDTRREDKVKQVLKKFENHPNKESFIQDFKQTKEINEFSKESQGLIPDMSNAEIFELCETSSKQQCLDCNLYWEAGIVYCSCGRCFRISRNERGRQEQQRCSVDTRLCYQEGKQARSQTWSF